MDHCFQKAGFVQDEGWYAAQDRYLDFLRRHTGQNTLYFESGVGGNTPGIVKFSFWKMAAENLSAAYACINQGEAYAPGEIMKKSVCINDDIGEVLGQL